MIEKKDLIHGAYYHGRCRNAHVARWNGDLNFFIHFRTKFGHTFLERIEHKEDFKGYDTFIPEALYPDYPGPEIKLDGG